MIENEIPLDEREKQAKALSLWMRGYQAQMDGHVTKAIHFYKESLGFFPTAEAHTFLGWAYSNQGDFNEAIEQCLRAIDTDPSFGNPYNDIGAYFIEQGKWEEAIPWLEKAVESRRYEPRHFPHFNLGRVYLHLKKPDEALEEFNKALEILPDYTPARRAISQINSRYN
ncbi:MAG TPA: tetratricopeptide repeat protein [bacterium]|jgi:tetratricopeptide (TPR) repeat protein|nr:tetratricopeptide repeat protein [bacterium]